MATICGSVSWYSTTCSSDHASAATVQRMTETCRRKASPSISESSFLRRRLGRRPDEAPLDLGDIATTDVRGRDDTTNYCATTARARVDVTSDARNASRAGSRARASPRGHSRSVKLTRAVPPSIQRRASRSRLTPGAARISVGLGESDVEIFSGSRTWKIRGNPGNSTILFLSSRGWVFRLCAFSNPLFLLILSGPGPRSPDWFAWAHKLRYLFTGYFPRIHAGRP